MILSEIKREVLKEDADLLYQEVETLMVQLKLDESLQKLQVLMNDYELLGEYELLLKCHINSAICHYNLGNVKLAFSLINSYEQMCIQYNCPINKVDYYPMLGLQYMYKQDYEKALFYYDLAADSALKESQYRLFVTAKKHTAHVASTIGSYEVGLRAIEEGKYILPKLSVDDINQIELLIVEIELYLRMGDYASAYDSIKRAGSHPMLTKDDVTHSLYCEYYAKYLFEIKDYVNAREYAYKGLALLEGTGQFVSEHDIYELLIKICTYIEDKTYLIRAYEGYVDSLKRSYDHSYSGELAKRDFEDLKKLTEIDNLTGVYNRKYLIDKASEWLNTAPMNTEAIICGVFDIDHFKQINDQYGHLMGDSILKELSNKCLELIKLDSMFVARYGGDEFVVVHRCTNIEQGIEEIRKIYTNLTNLLLDVNNKQFLLSISMGISHSNIGEFLLFEQLFERADEALYRSKENGRKLLTLY